MANVPEAGMKIDGTVLRVAIDHDDKGTAYGTVQVSNDDGISDVSFNADSTRTMQVANIAPGTPIASFARSSCSARPKGQATRTVSLSRTFCGTSSAPWAHRSMTEFTLSPEDWQLVGTFMILTVFSLGWLIFNGK